jgi:membrane peptidoglycan carboxypeptidase
MTNVHGTEVTGGSLPATIWRKFMTAALKGTPSASFKKPELEGVVMDYGGGEPTAKLAEAKPSPGATPSPGEALAAAPGETVNGEPGESPPNGQPGADTQPAAQPPAQRTPTPERTKPAPAPSATFESCFPFCDT